MDDSPKARRAALSPDSIVEAAFAVIEEEGIDEFSIRKLARRLGCEAMSVYHHFPSKAHLMDALVDRAVGEMPPIPPDLSFADQTRFVAHAMRALGHKRPSFYRFLSTHRMNTPRALAFIDAGMAVLVRAGFDTRTAAILFRVFGYYVGGAVLDETNGYAKGPSSVQVVTMDDLRRGFPHIAAAGPWFQRAHWDEIFETGLEILVEKMDQARPKPPE